MSMDALWLRGLLEHWAGGALAVHVAAGISGDRWFGGRGSVPRLRDVVQESILVDHRCAGES